MKILLIGFGYWGNNWARTLYKLGLLGAICDNAPESAFKAAEDYPDISFYNDLQQALEDETLEAAIIATPVPTHYAVTRQVLLANRSALVEKPITLNAQEAKELVELARETGNTLAVGHILMYHPGLLKLKELVDQGELGEILSVQCSRVNLGKIRNSENCWWSLAPHDLSIISLLLEEPLNTVAVSKTNLLERAGLEDAVYADFITPSGKRASVHVSWYSPFKKHETIVIGTEKIAIFEDTQPAEKKLTVLEYTLDRENDHVNSVQRGRETHVAIDTTRQPMENEALAFVEAIRHNTRLANDGQNGFEVVRNLEEVQNQLNAQPESFKIEELTPAI